MTAPSLATPSPLVSLFHDPAGTAFADLTIESHRETWPIRSKRFRSWLRRDVLAAPMRRQVQTDGSLLGEDCGAR